VVNATLRLVYPRRITAIRTEVKAAWAPGSVWKGEDLLRPGFKLRSASPQAILLTAVVQHSHVRPVAATHTGVGSATRLVRTVACF